MSLLLSLQSRLRSTCGAVGGGGGVLLGTLAGVTGISVGVIDGVKVGDGVPLMQVPVARKLTFEKTSVLYMPFTMASPAAIRSKVLLCRNVKIPVWVIAPASSTV